MNTNKLLTVTAFTAITCGVLAQSTPDLDLAEDPETNAAPAEVAAPAPKQDLREEGTDEIDLEEIDDSADAAKKPTITKNGENIQYVDISCDEASLADILRQFRKTPSANIICDDSTNLQQRVSVNLVHVHWLKGLEAILNMKGFRLEERERIFRVVEDHQKTPVFTRTFLLNHASATELAALFNKSYGAKDAKGKTTEVATAFPSANTVVISATEKQLAECEAIIRAVDKAVPQIYIEARFMELSSDAMHQLGMQWDSLQKAGVNLKGASFSVTDHAGENVDNATDWASTGDKRIFTGTLSATDFSLYMSAFEKESGTQIFSNPKVIVSNGKEAKVDMTTKYPNITVTSQRNTSSGTSYTDYKAQLEEIKGEKSDGKDKKGALFAGSAFYSWGIELSVKPRISPDGIISVEIVPSISQLDTDVTSDGFYKVKGGSNEETDDESAYGRYPIIKMKSITTEFSMKDGSTAVIGGLSRTTEEDVDNGIPYLRKIPWIGPHLFGWKSRQKVQKEIIICVTLGIANPAELPETIGLPTNAVIGREYVEGKRLEPGLRAGSAYEILSFDTDALDEIHGKPAKTRDGIQTKGEVTITPSSVQ